jgi:hypothetical protein
MVVLNKGIDFKAISWQTSELKVPESCHLLKTWYGFMWYNLATAKLRLTGFDLA